MSSSAGKSDVSLLASASSLVKMKNLDANNICSAGKSMSVRTDSTVTCVRVSRCPSVRSPFGAKLTVAHRCSV